MLGGRWDLTTESAKKMLILIIGMELILVKNHSNNNVYNITGYTSRKYINPQDAMSGGGARQKISHFRLFDMQKYCLLMQKP